MKGDGGRSELEGFGVEGGCQEYAGYPGSKPNPFSGVTN